MLLRGNENRSKYWMIDALIKVGFRRVVVVNNRALDIKPARLVTAPLIVAQLVITLARFGSLYKRAGGLARLGSFKRLS